MTPQKAIVTAVVVILMYLVLKKIWQYVKPSNYSADSFTAGGGIIPSGWSPKEYTDSLYGAIQGWTFSPDGLDAVSEEVFKLSDNQLIAISNDWKARYADDYGMTLLEAMVAEWHYIATWFGGVDNTTSLQTRLSNLGL